MKRRQRRPVLTLNKPQSNCHVDYTQNRCKPLNNVQPTQSEVNNPLANLCQYNSDSDTEDPKKDVQKLDDQVNDFLKEIQLIAPEQSVPNTVVHPSLATKTTSQSAHSTSQQTLWQECIDRDSGYPYYWHTETNETTWEMPEELRLIKKQSEIGSGTKSHSVQGTRWMDFSSITYRQSQTNIPEGMIPQEVVARNRNRFMHNETPKKSSSEIKTETKKESPAKDDDSDDGRIEMITSFGSDGSDSEDEDNSSDEKKTSLSRSSDSGNASFTSYPTSGEIGPVFCPTQGAQSLGASQSRSYKSDLASNSTNKSDERKMTKSDSKNNAEDTNKNKKDGRAYNEVPKLELNVSLVPGYGDDSDGEDEVKPKQEVKPLFPISQNEEEYVNPTNSKNSHSSFAKSADVTASDQCNDGNEDTQETKTSREKIAEEKDSKADEEKSKANIFLEDMQQVCGKAFQRKRRIAFDVTSAKKQNNVYHDNAVQDDNSSDLASSETSRNTEDSDAGTQSTSCAESKKERDETTKETEQCVGAVSEEKLGSKDELCDTESPAEPKPADAEEKDNEEMTELSQIVTEKLKFLSEGRESVSAVQTMQIQLQTLSTAWAAGSLEDSYFQKWLTSTNHELERLEEDVAPDGWLCQWDRSHKRYYYHNTSTGTSQWTYPDTGIAGGTEEMELCTTPPPESEELSVTELPGTNKTKEKEAADETGGNKTSEENTSDGQPAEQQAPPSQMSANSSSSSPSRIFATDMKSKKKRDRPLDDKSLDVKRKRLDRPTIPGAMQAVNPAFESLPYVQATVSPQTLPPNMEPLPPGVDLSDTSYEAATLKGIIYSAASQQGNAIYAPSIGNPTIPILGHQAGLLQESFVHYPFQHLQGAIAIANKHSGQSAVQLMVGYAPTAYTNKVITKPPEIIKASKESFKSALDSFYNDIACIEKPKQVAQHQDVAAATTSVMEQTPVPTEETKPEIVESETMPNDTTTKERKKKKTRITNKKHKEVSTMVAKWQKVQKNLENTV